MTTILRLREIRNWVPITLFIIIICTGVLFLKVTALRYLLILLFAVSVGTLARLQLIHREKFSQQINALNKLAYYDELTGIFNRRKIIGALTKALNNRTCGWVLLIDLDGFKQVNDVYGHHAGDQVLQQTAVRLRKILADNIQFARLGGDEFLVFADCSHEVKSLVAEIKQSIANPYQIDGISVCIGASVGAVALDESSTTVGDVLKQADRAMYADKTENKRQRTVASDALSNTIVPTRDTYLFNLLDGYRHQLVV